MSQERFFVPQNNQETIVLGKLASGEKVIVRKASHIHDNLNLEKYLIVALSRIVSNHQDNIAEEIDFGKSIGASRCVKTLDSDEIVFAMRPQRRGFTRFVKNREPEPTSKLTVILTRDRQTNDYLVLTTYIGERAEPEPWDNRATEKALDFWQNHALVYGSEPIVEGTETTDIKW